MIASLNGIVESKTLDNVIIDVGGVGYQVLVSSQTLAELPQPASPVKVLCYTYVREDALQLYGFAQDIERRVFELLISVSGVGPRLALTILSGMDVTTLSKAIADGNHARLQSIPGVGKRTAERLVVELREKVARLAVTPSRGGGSVESDHALDHQDVISALVNLGYKRALAEKAVQQVIDRYLKKGKPAAPEVLLRESLGVITGMQ